MSTQTPPTFADLVKAATSSDAPQVPPTGNPASSGSFDDLVKAATYPKESTQSSETAPVAGVAAGPTAQGGSFDQLVSASLNRSSSSGAAGDPAEQAIAPLTESELVSFRHNLDTEGGNAPMAIRSAVAHEKALTYAATISKRDFVPGDQSQYVYANNAEFKSDGTAMSVDPRSAKAEKDFWDYTQATGNRNTTHAREDQFDRRASNKWSQTMESEFRADVLAHQADVLDGRQIRMEQAIADGVDPAVFDSEKKDIEAGRRFVAEKFAEVGSRDPLSLIDKFNQRVQSQTDFEGRPWYSDTWKRMRYGGRWIVNETASGAARLLDPSSGYTLGDQVAETIDATEASMDTDIASAHKGGVWSKAEGWRGKAAVPMLGEGLTQLIGFIGSSVVGGEVGALSKARGGVAMLAEARAAASTRALIGTSFITGYDQFIDQAISSGEHKEDMDGYAKIFGALNAMAERYINPQLWLTRGPEAKNAFIEAIRSRSSAAEATKAFWKGAGQEVVEETTQNYGQAGVNFMANYLSGSQLETTVSAEDNINSVFGAGLLGGIGEVGGNSNFGSKKLKQQAVVWAMNNPEAAKSTIERFVPKEEQKPFIEKMDAMTKVYVGNVLGGVSTEKAAKVVDIATKKAKVEKSLKDSPMDAALAEVMKDPRVEEREKLAREMLTEMGIEGQKQEDALVAAGIIKAPLDADGKEVKPKNISKVNPPTQDTETGQEEVDPDEEVEIAPVGEATDLDAALASVTPAMNKALDTEVENAAKSLAGSGVKVVVHDNPKSFAEAFVQAGPSRQREAIRILDERGITGKEREDLLTAAGYPPVDFSRHEGFYDQGNGTIHINRVNNREGLTAHEGTHALFMGALGATENGRTIIAEAAKQVLSESPGIRADIARFLEGYGGAIRGADGAIDVEATAANPKLAHEVYAEFVSSVASGATKLNSGLRTWLKDMYNKVMATLGVSMKFDPKTDDDFIKLAADLASAMKTGRVIRNVAGERASGEVNRMERDARMADHIRKYGPRAKSAEDPVTPDSSPIMTDNTFGNMVGGGSAMSVRRASDLAQQLDVAATQAEEVFFGDVWPNLLKKVGNVFKPTKAGFQQAADLAVSDVNEFTRDNPRYADYYHKDWELVEDMVSNAFPIIKEKPELMGVFRVIAGLMSPQTSLKQNMKEAVSAFDHWLNKGNFDAIKIVPSGNLYKMGKTPFIIAANTAVNKARSIKAFDQLIKKHGPKKAVEMLMEPVSVKELKEFNSSLGYVNVGDIGRIKNAVRTATGQDEKIPRVFVFGPKLGAYTMNSLGDGRFTTVDIWESRFIRSYFPKMFANAGGVIANSVDDSDVFTEFSKQFAEVFKKKNGFELEPSAYQAMRWFTMIDAAKKANYKYALTDGTISDYTAEALRDIKGHVVPGYTGRDGYSGARQDDPVDIPFSIRRGSASGDTGGRAESGKNLIPKDFKKNLTSDGDGNYLFYHYGEDLKGGRINPKYSGTGADKGSRNEGRNNNISMYYTKPDERESMVSGDVHVVKVPDYKVYPFNTDPLGLYDKAEKMFRKDYGDYIDFSPVKQADYMGHLAAKAGFDMMVAQWSKFPLRGETTKALKWDREATDEARSPALSTGSQKFNDIARALIAAGHNTKAKAKAYLKGRGHEGISDAVIEEMGRILKAQREIRNRKDAPPVTPEQAVAIDSAISSIVSDQERVDLKAKIEADAKIAQAATKAAATGLQKGASAGYNQGVAAGTLAGEIAGKQAGRKEGAREGAAEAARQRDLFVKSVRAHLAELGTKFTEAKTKTIMTRAVSVNPGNRNQVERFLAYLDAKIDEANEAALTSAVDRIIDMTNPARYKQTNESGILKGKIDDRVRKLLGVIHSAVKGMTLDEVSDKIDAIDSALFSPDANVALLEDQLEAYRIAYGALSGDPEGIAGAEEAVKEIIAEGRSRFREVLAAKHERYVAMRNDAIAAITGGEGVKSGFDEVKLEEKKRNFLNHMLDGIGSYLDMNEGLRTLLDKIDRSARDGDPWSGKLDQFYRKVANSRNTMNTRAIATLDEMRAKLEDIYGGKQEVGRAVNENSKVKSLGNFTDLNGNNVEMLLSQNRAYYLYNLMKSPENEATFREMGFTEEMKNAVIDFMTPQVKEWADWQTDVFYKNMYQDVNAVYKGLNYIDLPKNKYFTPIRRVGVDDSAPVEVGKFQRSAAGVVNGSLKERTGSTKPFDLTTDGDSVLYQYVAAMNHYIAFAETVRDLNATFGSSDVRKAISQNANSADNKIIERFIDAIANDGRNRSLTISLFDRLRGLHATAKLSLNMVVALKQLSAMPAYMTDLSPKDFAVGLMDFMRHPIESSNVLMESAYIQERYKSGFDRDMAIAMARDYQKAFSGKSTLMDKLMFNVRWGDKAAVFSGGWAVYKYHHDKAIKAGKSEAEAKRIGLSEMDEATKMSQQSTGTEDLSDFQRGGSMAKLFTMYKTSPLAYFRQERKGIRDMARGLKTGDKVLAGDGLRRFIVYHFVLPAVFQFVANALPGVLTSPDDDDDKDMLRALALGSLNGMFILGDMLEFIGDRVTGKPWATKRGSQAVEVPVFKSMSDMLASVSDAIGHWAKDEYKLTEDMIDASLEAIDFSGIPAKKVSKMWENGKFTAEYWDELTPGERAALVTGYDLREIGDGYGGHLQNPENQ